MAETGFQPEGFARAIAGREAGAKRLDAGIIGKGENDTLEKTNQEKFRNASLLKEEFPAINKNSKKNEKTWEEMRRIEAEDLERSALQMWGGTVQGEYEEKIKEANTDNQKGIVQEKYKDKFDPKEKEKEAYRYTDAYDEKQYATPLETIYGIATVENQLFDRVRDTMVKSGRIKDPKHLTFEEHQIIQEQIDSDVRQIGMNLLRGITFSPPSVAQIFYDKAISDAYKLLKPKKKDK